VALPPHEHLRHYEVFARHDKQPRLRHVGEVQAEDDDDAVVFAYTLYDERRWQEMLVVPRSAIVTLIRPE
jgi:1,2-phenylacetyl-CoA epoxidase PaaB subunit